MSMTPTAGAILAIQSAGEALEKSVSAHPSTAFSEAFAKKRELFRKQEVLPHLETLICELLNRHLSTPRWFDVLHTPAGVDSRGSQFNEHTPIAASLKEPFFRDALWPWYKGLPNRLFLTPRVFNRVKRGAIVTNDLSLPESHEGFDVICVNEDLQQIAQAIRLNDVAPNASERSLTTLLESISHEELAHLTDCTGFRQFISLTQETAQLTRSWAAFLMTTHLYECGPVAGANPHGTPFYYIYLPFLPRLSQIVTGTAVGLWSPTAPNHPLLQELTSINDCWAQYIVRAEDKRQRAVAQYTSEIAAIMARNFSHNVGSHCLANPNLHSALKGQPRRLSTFHSYAQGRLDFMARTMSGGAGSPEPLFFVNDLMNGFFRQAVLLETLVDDRGFRAERIQFCVSLPTGSAVVYRWCAAQGLFRPSGNEVNDELVGIPGGMTGRHAHYAFLENVLRNAAKYGRAKNSLRADENIEITLTLRNCRVTRPEANVGEDVWVLTIVDNLSADDDFETSTQIRGFIADPLIDADGARATGGHGIQEMKACAGILAGDLLFNPDPIEANASYSETIGDPQHARLCECCQAYAVYRSDATNGKKFETIPSREPLRCFSGPVHGKRLLHYQLLLPTPVLLSIVGGRPVAKVDGIPQEVRIFERIEDLVCQASHFAIVVDDNMCDPKQTLDKVAANHQALPFRLIVLISSDVRKEIWTKVLKEFEGVTADGTKIPHRRIRVLNDAALHEAMKCAIDDQRFVLSFSFLNEVGWRALYLRIYDAWLRVFKPLPNGCDAWRVMIGFERQPEQIFGTDDDPSPWKVYVKDWAKSSQSSVSLYVEARHGTAEEIAVSANWPKEARLSAMLEVEANLPVHRKSYLLFDNHGNVFGKQTQTDAGYYQCPRFAQKIGLGHGLSLYQALESPPATKFGFAWLVYTHTEAALTRIAILDERFAQACIPHNHLLDGAESKFQKAGLFPLFSIRGGTAGSVFVSDQIQKACAALSTERQDELNAIAEGLTISPDLASVKAVYRSDIGGKIGTLDGEPFDVLIIHEGIADILPKLLWSSTDSWKLFGCAPMVVRTSGRGRDSRHLDASLPFLEFTELSENTYRDLNKVAISGAVLGAVGERRKDVGGMV